MLSEWVSSLPEPFSSEMSSLYREMSEMRTVEAKIFKALDNAEAVITHNEADLSTWIEKEYTLNLTYGEERCAFSEYLAGFRRILREVSEEKIEKESKRND